MYYNTTKHNIELKMNSNFKLIEHLIDLKIWISTSLLFILQALPIEPIKWIQKYIFNDFSFLKWLMIVMAIDLVTGITRVWKNQGLKAVSSRGLRDSVTKVVQYGAFLIVTHIVTHFEIGGQVAFPNAEWVNKMAYEFLIVIEIKSVYENIIRINPKLDFMKDVIDTILTTLKTKRDNNLGQGNITDNDKPSSINKNKQNGEQEPNI